MIRPNGKRTVNAPIVKELGISVIGIIFNFRILSSAQLLTVSERLPSFDPSEFKYEITGSQEKG
ncbi:MAG: hypothetical protein A2854_01970 [Parcubacteria group bacterium RIFCSPHIGHO2_01_FULL_56_18]|nr:MAG: hypothetical protein A2854_01970 [Parcubacteria group bacterium RIFCSPHIGHO2_01_FULL_56_18]